MRRMYLPAMTLALAVALTAAACSKSTPTATGSTTSSPPPAATSPAGAPSSGGTFQVGNDTANNHGTANVTGLSSVNVEQHNASDYYFSPTILAGSAGQQISVHLENKGSLPHNFTIDAQNVNVTLQPGASQDVQVTLPSTGVVEFYCSFHHALGMAGELSVA